MRDLAYAPRPDNKGERIAIMFICSLLAALIGWVSIFMSGAFKEEVAIAPYGMSNVLTAISWTLFYFLNGFALYLIIGITDKKIKAGERLKNWCVSLWTLQYLMCLILPFFFYGLNAHVLSFVWAALIAASLSALIILCLKHRALASLICLPLFAFAVYLNYITLYAAVVA